MHKFIVFTDVTTTIFLTEEHAFAEFCEPTNKEGFHEIITQTSFLVIGTLDDQNVPPSNTILYYEKLT
jgi:hypothetical protein